MSRLQYDLVTMVGCLVSLVSFCFFPYLVVPFSPFTFTGVQLLTLGDQIPLPHYSVVQDIPAILQNVPFIWAPPMVVALLFLVAVGDMVLIRREKLVSLGRRRVMIVAASLTLFLVLCSWASNAGAGFSGMAAHGNTLAGFIHGSLLTPGFFGFLVGVLVALTGSGMTLRAKS